MEYSADVLVKRMRELGPDDWFVEQVEPGDVRSGKLPVLRVAAKGTLMAFCTMRENMVIIRTMRVSGVAPHGPFGFNLVVGDPLVDGYVALRKASEQADKDLWISAYGILDDEEDDPNVDFDVMLKDRLANEPKTVEAPKETLFYYVEVTILGDHGFEPAGVVLATADKCAVSWADGHEITMNQFYVRTANRGGTETLEALQESPGFEMVVGPIKAIYGEDVYHAVARARETMLAEWRKTHPVRSG